MESERRTCLQKKWKEGRRNTDDSGTSRIQQEENMIGKKNKINIIMFIMLPFILLLSMWILAFRESNDFRSLLPGVGAMVMLILVGGIMNLGAIYINNKIQKALVSKETLRKQIKFDLFVDKGFGLINLGTFAFIMSEKDYLLGILVFSVLLGGGIAKFLVIIYGI